MHELIHFIGRFLSHPIFYLTLSSISIIYILVFIYLKHKEFHSTDPSPELLYLQTHKGLELIPNIPNIVEVKTGIYIKNFPVFNLLKNEFIIDALIWFEFNPSLVQLEVVKNFSFERGIIISQSIPEMKLEKNLLLVKYNVRIKLSTNLDHKYFPMNDHILHIVITNESISPLELFFSAQDSSFSWSKRLYTHDWDIVRKTVKAGYSDLILGRFDKDKVISHPRVVYSLFLARAGMRKAALIFIPLLTIYLLGTYSLILEPKKMFDPILTIGIGSISGLLAYRFVIEKISPNVGYFTLTEYFFTIVLASSFVTFLIDLLRTVDPSNLILEKMGHGWFIITQLVVIFSFQYYLSKWRRKTKKIKKKIITPKIEVRDVKKEILKNLTLSQLTEYANNTPEFPVPDNKNWLNLDYSTFYNKYKKNYFQYLLKKLFYFLKIEKPPAWTPALFKNCLVELVQRSESVFRGDYIVKIKAKTGHKLIIWGDLQGAFHSLIRGLDELKKQDIIDDSLKITSPDFFIAFNGDLIDRSPYVLETLTVTMVLMLNNPEQVFYIKGNHEVKNVWQDFQTYQEIKIKTKFLGKEVISLLVEYLERFFDTLPIALYVKSTEKEDKGVIRISHYQAKDLPYNEGNIGDFIFSANERTVDFLALDGYIGQGKKFVLNALIVGLSRSTIYKVTKGLELLPPDMGATTWSILSAPITTYRKLYNFHFDNFLIINIKGITNQWLMTLYSQDIRKLNGFKTKLYHLVYGIEVDDLKAMKLLEFKKEIVVGCTLDLSKTSAILGERIREGLNLSLARTNLQGGVNHRPIHTITFDDQYTPHLAKQNILLFMETFHSDLVISPVGTPTTEALLSLIQEKKILVLFPYTGANIFRKPELNHIIHFRPSYAKEAMSLVRYTINSLGLRRLALFYQNDAYGWAPLEGAREALKNMEFVEWIETPYQRNDPNVDEAAKKILSFNPSAILFFSTHAPSVALIHVLGVNNLNDKVLLGISFLTDSFRTFLRTFGLELTISRIVPQIYANNLPIIDEYLSVAKSQKTFIHTPSADSFEGYINASIFSFALESITEPITKDKIIQFIEGINRINFKGLELNFDPETRELSEAIWLDTGAQEWIDASEL